MAMDLLNTVKIIDVMENYVESVRHKLSADKKRLATKGFGNWGLTEVQSSAKHIQAYGVVIDFQPSTYFLQIY